MQNEPHKKLPVVDACYDEGAPHLFLRFPQLRSLRPLSPKNRLKRTLKLLFWVKEPRHSENVFARKRYTLYNLRRFWVNEPRHPENVFARKRYTLIHFTTILGQGTTVIQRKHFRRNVLPLDRSTRQ